MKRPLCSLLAALMFSFSIAAMASEAVPLAADPVAEARLQALSAELRCLVCQNQSIADSNAELAVDLRNEVRKMIQSGKSDKEIVEFLVSRYGDFVLYRPPVKGLTLFLWGGPALLLFGGIFALVRHLRRRNQTQINDLPLSAEEAQRAEAMLKSQEPKV